MDLGKISATQLKPQPQRTCDATNAHLRKRVALFDRAHIGAAG